MLFGTKKKKSHREGSPTPRKNAHGDNFHSFDVLTITLYAIGRLDTSIGTCFCTAFTN